MNRFLINELWALPFLISVISCSLVFGQTIEQNLDSLNEALEASSSIDMEVEVLLEAGKLLLRTNPDSAISIYGRAEGLAPAGSVNSGLALAYQALGYIYQGRHEKSKALIAKARVAADVTGDYDLKTIVFGNAAIGCFYRGEYDSALVQFEAFLALALEHQHNEDIAIASNNIGLLNLNMGNYHKAYDGFVIAATAFETLGYEESLSQVYNNIALANRELDNFEEALKYNRLSIAMKRRLGDTKGLIASYANIGSVYEHLEAQIDSALYYYDLALPMAKEVRDTRNLLNIYAGLITTHQQLANYDQSIAMADEAYLVLEEFEDQEMKARIDADMAHVYLDMGAFEKAVALAAASLEISSANGYRLVTQHNYDVLSEGYGGIGAYRQAYEYQKALTLLSDSILNENKSNQIAELQAKYETEKKEQTIALQQAEITGQQARNQLNLAVILGLVLIIGMLIALILLVRSRARKRQALLVMEAETLLRETQIAAAIDSQESERKRVARDLHDGFGQMISVLNLNLKSLEKGTVSKEKVFDESAKILEDMYRELKGICFNLMPETLIRNGITHALKEFAERINRTDGPKVNTDDYGLDERLNDLQEISVYRITQEWVNNIIKYSDAEKITISLTKDEEEITLLIEDDGAGFDPQLLIKGSGNGWKNMQTRTNLIKGTLELETTVDVHGSALIMNAPTKDQHQSEKEQEELV